MVARNRLVRCRWLRNMNVFWVFLIDVVFLSRISAATYMSKCVLVVAGSIAISFADLSLYIEDDEEDHYFFVKKQEPQAAGPKEDEVTMMTRFHKQCINETKVLPEDITKLSKGDWNLNNPKLKEWAFCVLIKMELMSNQAVYRLDVAFSRLPSNLTSTAESLIDKCLSIKEMAPVQTAWEYLRCLNKEDPKGKYAKLGVFYNIIADIK